MIYAHIGGYGPLPEIQLSKFDLKTHKDMTQLQEKLEAIQAHKINIIREVALTPVYAGARLNDMFAAIEKSREEEMQAILDNSGYDFNYPLSDTHIISLMIQAHGLGKDEQVKIHNHGLDK